MMGKINTIKKILASAALFSFSALSFAVETGGLFTNDTKFHNIESDGDLKLDQKNGISLWLRAPLTEDGSSYFTTEGSFKTEYDASVEDDDDKFILTADLDLLKLVLKKEIEQGTLLFSAGRFYFSDLTGLVLGQNSDGAQLDFSSSIFGASVYASYTGLLNEKNITILDSEESETPDSKKLYSLAKKYVIAGLQLSASNFAAGQTVALEGLTAIRLEDGEAYNRFYGTLSLSGPIVSSISLYYNLSTTLGILKTEDDTFKGNLSKLSVSLYPDFKSASLSLNGVYASGAQGSFDGFMGFTSQTAVESIAQPEYSGLVLAGLSGSIKPISNLLLTASGDFVFDAASGTDENEIEMAGFQYSLGANYQIVSDVSLGLSFGQFIGKGDYTDEEKESALGGNKTQLKISASIAF